MADMRFRSIYNVASDEWILQIQYVQKRDAGRYECQINTQPVRSYFVQLRVVGKLKKSDALLICTWFLKNQFGKIKFDEQDF